MVHKCSPGKNDRAPTVTERGLIVDSLEAMHLGKTIEFTQLQTVEESVEIVEVQLVRQTFEAPTYYRSVIRVVQ